jgi:hypothetical protein
MEPEKDTVEVMGKKFLRCQQEDCEWNVGWLGGYDWTEEPGKGTRICNLGARAILDTKAEPPDDCQQSSAVYDLACAEFEL